MNRELIEQLYHEAVDHCVALGPNPDGSNRAWVWEEKYAELVIGVCIDELIIKARWCQSEGNDEIASALCDVVDGIRKEFGLE